MNSDDPAEWLDRYGDAMLSFAMARLSDRNNAEDVVQEAFLAAVRNADSFDQRGSRQTWLIGILKHKIMDHYRRANTPKGGKGRVSFDEKSGELGGLFNERGEFKRRLGKWPADPAKALQDNEFWDVFDRCRQALPPNLMAAFSLREMDQVDTASVCSELGISASNLNVRIHRARLLLRECLERKWFRHE